jgi:hypothetical protein
VRALTLVPVAVIPTAMATFGRSVESCAGSPCRCQVPQTTTIECANHPRTARRRP